MKSPPSPRVRTVQASIVVLLLACFLWCEQSSGVRSISPRRKDTIISRDIAMDMHGWPILHNGTLDRALRNDDSPFFQATSIARFAIAFNLLAVLIVIFCSCRVARRALEYRGSLRQFGLKTLLQFSIAAAVLSACWTFGPQPTSRMFNLAKGPPAKYQISKLDEPFRAQHFELLPAPMAPSQPWFIRLPLIAALGCTFYLAAEYLFGTIAELFQETPAGDTSLAETADDAGTPPQQSEQGTPS